MTSFPPDDERVQRAFDGIAAELEKALKDTGQSLPPDVSALEVVRSFQDEAYRLSQTEEGMRARAEMQTFVAPIYAAVAAELPDGASNPRFGEVLVARLKAAWAARLGQSHGSSPPASA